MSKLVTFFIFMAVGIAVLSGIMAGGGGMVATELTAAIDEDDSTIYVDDVSGFLDGADYIYVGDEAMLTSSTNEVAGTINISQRGAKGTSTKEHAIGEYVYSEGLNALNGVLGYNAQAEADSRGWAAFITIPFKFLSTTIPYIITMNFKLMTGEMAIVSYFFFAALAGAIISIALVVFGAVFGR